MMPDDLSEFDARDVHMYVTVDGEEQEVHGYNSFSLEWRASRQERRKKVHSGRKNHVPFYRKDKQRPWVN